MKIEGSAKDPLWYKDAIIYETHVKAFLDSTNDGIGDFRGLLQKLDYLQDVGVTCLWLLPFYPSPLRDDGYDIAYYNDVNPAYGTVEDFKAFVEAAHQRNIQVLIELVVNHTSDQHPWFHRARKAPAGSPERDFYVWSETDQKYKDVRIIFVDTETSNWAWDHEAQAYYWHRFFSHQPDLNYDNPLVLKEIIDVMKSWLDLGVDALRLDAVPYLVEREGTSCENLPETHAVIREIRRQLDARYSNRVFVGEANQWPADVRPYFGDGEECHMAFHFPLMPRIFMGVQMEDRHPIVEIMAQTPEIPDVCQWALFLRNHDELTLEMVTDVERDYMYRAYSADPRMRCNIGIRRRLAPLLQNNRRRIELLNSLLFSFKGTPVIYYGDEIGMGDNIYLPDRDGVRTPMQWSADRNAGFSRANPARLYSPVIMDSIYGYEAINVEAQVEDPSSLLNWMKNLIAVRKAYKVFGRGSIEFLHPRNRKVLTYVRRHEGTVVLCVANLSRFPQPCELDLAEFKGMTPVEMLGDTPFPPIGELPYFLTLAGYAFYWFELQTERQKTLAYRVRESVEPVVELPEMVILALRDEGPSLFVGTPRETLQSRILPEYLPRQRWFGAKTRRIRQVAIRDWARMPTSGPPAFFSLVEVSYGEGQTEIYSVPVGVARGRGANELIQNRPEFVISRLTTPYGPGALQDALADEAACQAVLGLIEQGGAVATQHGEIRAFPLADLSELRGAAGTRLPAKLGSAEQSNTSIRYGDKLILKLFRRLEYGPNVDYEMNRYLAEQGGFRRVPRLAGAIEYRTREGAIMTLGMMQELVHNQGDGWQNALDELGRYYERWSGQAGPPPELASRGPTLLQRARVEVPDDVVDTIGLGLEWATVLGKRTAEMHLALARDTDNPAFQPEPITGDDLEAISVSMSALAARSLDLLTGIRSSLAEVPQELADRILAQRDVLLDRLRALPGLSSRPAKTRAHGDYHLGQVLNVENDFYILDFEGEPARPLEERRAKQSPFKDVAGMMRSFGYAAYGALLHFSERRGVSFAALEPWARLWETWTAAAFLREYFVAAEDAPFIPALESDRELLIEAFALEKAFYELSYELNNRPDWVQIPLIGILHLAQIVNAEEK